MATDDVEQQIISVLQQYCRTQLGNECEHVKLLSRKDMEEQEYWRGKYDQGIRLAEAKVVDKIWDLQHSLITRETHVLGYRHPTRGIR